jgi:DNA-binding MarR family transcriptional regulator
MNSQTIYHLDSLFRKKWAERRRLLWKLLRDQYTAEKKPIGADPRDTARFTPEQYDIITVLDSFGHGVPVKDITELIDLPFANITRTLDRLEKKGLIRRSKGKDDKRQVIIRLTLEGSRAARRLAHVRENLLTATWGMYDEAEQGILINLLERLV